MLLHTHVPDLDDQVWHYLLIGIGLCAGSLVKVGFDKIAGIFWDKEWKEFQKWKAAQKAVKE